MSPRSTKSHPQSQQHYTPPFDWDSGVRAILDAFGYIVWQDPDPFGTLASARGINAEPFGAWAVRAMNELYHRQFSNTPSRAPCEAAVDGSRPASETAGQKQGRQGPRSHGAPVDALSRPRPTGR